MTAPALPGSNLNNPGLRNILFAIMVKRLGGTAFISQADIDQVAYTRLMEKGKSDGSIEFRLIETPRQ